MSQILKVSEVPLVFGPCGRQQFGDRQPALNQRPRPELRQSPGIL